MSQLALVIDLNSCVGCNACVTSCNEQNNLESGNGVRSALFNQVQTYETGDFNNCITLHFPKSCLHCEDPPCVPVCPTGASYKRKEDGIVLVDYDKCIGCDYCSWACPYGARELDPRDNVMKKCTLCVDRIYDKSLPKEQRKPACVLVCPTNARIFGDINNPNSRISSIIANNDGYQLMPEWGIKPANHYLKKG